MSRFVSRGIDSPKYLLCSLIISNEFRATSVALLRGWIFHIEFEAEANLQLQAQSGRPTRPKDTDCQRSWIIIAYEQVGQEAAA